MNHSTRVIRRPRGAWLPDVLIATAIIAAVALALLLVAACSSGSGPSVAGAGAAPKTSGAATSPASGSQAVAFAHCMRSHGVPRYPDPNSANTMPDGLPKVGPQELGVSTAQFQTADTACGHLLPNGGHVVQSVAQRLLSGGLKFARCMRSHGVPNWPDPARSTPAALALGAPPYMYQMGGIQGLDGRSFPAHVTATMHECLHLTHLNGAQVPNWSG